MGYDDKGKKGIQKLDFKNFLYCVGDDNLIIKQLYKLI